jgi:hypothetical protein
MDCVDAQESTTGTMSSKPVFQDAPKFRSSQTTSLLALNASASPSSSGDNKPVSAISTAEPFNQAQERGSPGPSAYASQLSSGTRSLTAATSTVTHWRNQQASTLRILEFAPAVQAISSIPGPRLAIWTAR